MNKAIKKLAAVSCAAVLLFCNCLTAFAEVRLPEGTVAGLPEKLTVLDSDGNSVSSSTGEYFFTVEDMEPFVTYSKDIQIMNLREDKAYHIYFYAHRSLRRARSICRRTARRSLPLTARRSSGARSRESLRTAILICPKNL